MRNVWYCIPAKRVEGSTLPLWRERGYKIATFSDDGDPLPLVPDLSIQGIYEGYAISVNKLVKAVLAADPSCSWLVTGGDDIKPEPTHSPEEIAEQCTHHFSLEFSRRSGYPHDIARSMPESSFGVMQPTGDRNGEQEDWAHRMFPNAPAYIDRICGSPWMGRTFCERVYGGRGPLWPEFYHMYVDEHLQNVVRKLDILWQRRDLIHKHDCAALRNEPKPEFLNFVYTRKHWDEAKAIFLRLKEGGFAESAIGL